MTDFKIMLVPSLLPIAAGVLTTKGRVIIDNEDMICTENGIFDRQVCKPVNIELHSEDKQIVCSPCLDYLLNKIGQTITEKDFKIIFVAWTPIAVDLQF